MPLDSTALDDQEGKLAFESFYENPTRKGLAYALRHPEVWPKDFGPWDYRRSETCARGLARKIAQAQTPRESLRNKNTDWVIYGIPGGIYEAATCAGGICKKQSLDIQP